MTIFLFSDKKYEQQSIACIKSLKLKIDDTVKIIYYTLGFKSEFTCKNLIIQEYTPSQEFYKLNFIKPELCLYTMKHYTDTHYLYLDTDFFLCKKVNLNDFKHDEIYPLASYGPVEFPCIFNYIGGTVHTETTLMQYFGVPGRTMRYVWNCIFSFNNNCLDFIEEWESMCTNKYLLGKGEKIFPSQDETAFNVCLWKRNATKNYGFGFLNTVDVKKVVFTEENKLNNFYYGENLDCNSYDWEHVHNSDALLGYHAFKNADDMNYCSDYLTSNEKITKPIFIIDCYIDNKNKIEILKNTIQSIKKLGMDILIVSHCTLPVDVIESVEYYLYDGDNTFNQINFYTSYTYSNANIDIVTRTSVEDNIKSHEFPIIKSIRNSLSFVNNLGYTSFVFSEYDCIFTDDDINKIQQLSFKIFSKDKKYVFFNTDNFCETIFFMGNPEYVLNMVNSYFPQTVDEYNLKFTYNYPYGLELFFNHMLLNYKDDGIIVNDRFAKYFDTENKNLSNVSSISVNIVPDVHKNHWLCVTSLDKIVYTVIVKNEDVVINKFDILDSIVPAYKFETDKSSLDVEFYGTDQTIFKTIKVNFDIKDQTIYERKGLVTFK